jgi:ferredoxin
MKVVADRDVCIGAGMCVMTAAAIFDQDEDGIVAVDAEELPVGQQQHARTAVSMCPSGALRLIVD